MTLRYYLDRNRFNILTLITAVIVGTAVGFAVPSIVQQSLYRLVMIALGVLIVLSLLVSRAPRRMLVVFLAFAVPLNLVFTPFGDPAWHPGGAPEIFVIYLYDVPLIGLIGLWFVESLALKRPFRLTLAEGAAIALIIWGVLTLNNSINHSLTLMETVRLAKLVLMAHAVASTIDTKEALRDVMIGFIAGLMLQSLFAGLQYWYEFDLGGLGFTVGDVRRVSGTVGWPNTLGAYAAAIICIPVALWITGAARKSIVLVMASIVAGVLPIVFSFSRGAWVGLAIAIIVMYLLGVRRRWISVGGFLSQLVIITLLTGIAAFAMIEQINERAEQDTLSVREELNNIAFNMIRENPVLGVGLNTFVEAMRPYDPRNIRAFFREPVHNVYLLLASEAGIVGLGLFVLVVVFVLRDALYLVRQTDHFISAVAIGLIGSLTVILVTNLSDVHLRTDVLYAIWWIIVGLILGQRRVIEDTQREWKQLIAGVREGEAL